MLARSPRCQKNACGEHLPIHHPEPKRTALGCSCKQNIGVSMGNHHKHEPALFSLYNRSTAASRNISDLKKRGFRKNQENDCQTGSRAWTRPCLCRGGGGVHVLVPTAKPYSTTVMLHPPSPALHQLWSFPDALPRTRSPPPCKRPRVPCTCNPGNNPPRIPA